MLTLLSPAKKLNMEPVDLSLPVTQPELLEQTKILMQTVRRLSAQDLKSLMKLSDKLAELNYERFQSFRTDGRANSAKPAAFAFNGNVYEGLDAPGMSTDALAFAQEHLRILSGLYGVLRPLDLIQPYRLEMGTRLETERGHNLYQFWGRIIADKLREQMAGHKDKTVVNLASNEYVKAVDRKALDAPMIEARFLNIKDGQARNLMYYAKKARGQMARWIMDNQIDTHTDLRGFNIENYAFDKSASSEDLLVFTRQQPAPKAKAA